MANNKREKSKRLEMAEDGVLHSQYTMKSWFVKVRAAYSIERVGFDFVMKGKNGEGIAIYVDMDIFDLWADDILDGTLARIIAAEKKAGEEYPKHYKFITGDKGQKSVGIAASSAGNGFVINGVSTITVKENGKEVTKKVSANVPVDYNWLRILAKYFKRTSEVHFDELAKITLDASKKPNNVLDAEDKVTEEAKEKSVPEQKDATKNKPQANPAAAKTKASNEPKPAKTAVFVTSSPQPTSRGYEAEAYARKKDGSKASTKLTLIIKDDADITKEEYMNLYNATTQHKDVLVTFEGYADPKDKTTIYLMRFSA